MNATVSGRVSAAAEPDPIELTPEQLDEVSTFSYRPVDRVCPYCGAKHFGPRADCGCA